jgi:hypothetical protein
VGSECPFCFDERVARLREMSLRQEVAKAVSCEHCEA